MSLTPFKLRQTAAFFDQPPSAAMTPPPKGSLTKFLRETADEIERLREALKPFAEVPPGGRGVGARMMVTFAGDGPFHFFEGDLVRAKEVYRGLEQSARPKEG